MDSPRRRLVAAARSPASCSGLLQLPMSAHLALLFSLFFWRHAAAEGDGSGMTALQKHASFFDRNKDGVVTLSETYEGFRALGVGVALSSAGSAFINGALGAKTTPENASSMSLSVYVENIHKAIHGSDTGTYDAEGRFVPEKFEEIFTKHTKTKPDALTRKEIDEMLHANRKPKDYKGWLGAKSEWTLLYDLAKDKEGFLHKDSVRDVYDGTLFFKLEQEKVSSEKKA